jgi:hypothetical protein
MSPPTLLVAPQCNEHFFMFFAVRSAPRYLQHIAVPSLKASVDMEFNNKRQRLTDPIFNKDDAYADHANEDSMDYDYDSGVGGSILSSSFGGGGIGGGGIGAPISSAYLSSRGPTCEYEEAAGKKRKVAVARFVAISSGGSDHGSTFPAKVRGKKGQLQQLPFSFHRPAAAAVSRRREPESHPCGHFQRYGPGGCHRCRRRPSPYYQIQSQKGGKGDNDDDDNDDGDDCHQKSQSGQETETGDGGDFC